MNRTHAAKTLLLAVLIAPAALAQPPRPSVIAHRGGMAHRPQNTMAAFRNAVALGAEVLEFDMGVTADDRVVLHHNLTIDTEICSAEGSRVQGLIRSLTYPQIRLLDCGSRRSEGFPDQQLSPGERIPSLEELAREFRGKKVILFGETKMASDGSPGFVEPEKFVRLVYGALRKQGVTGQFLLQSSDYRTLDEMRKLDPSIGRCLVGARRYKPDYMALVRKHHATHIMLHYNDLATGDMATLRAAGLKIYSSTANNAEDWRRYLDLGMDGILTDNPGGLIAYMKGRESLRKAK